MARELEGKIEEAKRCFNWENMAKGVQLSSGLFYNEDWNTFLTFGPILGKHFILLLVIVYYQSNAARTLELENAELNRHKDD